MTDSASNVVAIVFGLAVFALIVAVGWRSVQNRRILRLQGANGQETIVIAGEDDDVSSIVTTTTAEVQPVVVDNGVAANTGSAERARLDRVVSSTK